MHVQVIAGTAVGMESCALPTLVIVVALLGSYYLGMDSGIVAAGTDTPIAGFFGTAVATMGMLSSASFVLTMDFFGPISDNAGGIVEMSGEPEEVCARGCVCVTVCACVPVRVCAWLLSLYVVVGGVRRGTFMRVRVYAAVHARVRACAGACVGE